MNTGKINSIQSMGTLDGPGIRCVIFMQGCMLRCKYCHNPETWDVNKGKEITSEDLGKTILKYRNYYGKNGGITVSGGEPLMQAEFVTELFKFCKEHNINTALDTSGCIMNESVRELLKYTDLCILDYKMTTEEDYKRYIGGSLLKTESFLRYLDTNNINTWIRQVIVPGINDSKDSLDSMKNVLKRYNCISKTELLAFKKICRTKYEELGMEFEFKNIKEPDIEKVKEYERYILNNKENRL